MADAQHVDPPSTLLPTLVPSSGIVRQVAPTQDIVAAQQAYHGLCVALLDDSDHQTIGKKNFRKKSAWRKLAVAFNVSVELLDRTYERDANGRIIRAEVIARATAPNGRTMDGLGACDLYEKCCPGTDGESQECTNRSQYHKHCRVNCNGKPHFSNPSHDLPSTAHTRATNRACADLFGMGEVSAEEIVGGHAQYDDSSLSSARPGAAPDRSACSVCSTPLGNEALKKVSGRYIHAACAGKSPAPPTEVSQSAPAAQEQPESSSAASPAPTPTPAAPADKDPEEVLFDRITAEVAQMPLATVRKTLVDLLDPATKQPYDKEGQPNEVRSRLALALFQQQARSA